MAVANALKHASRQPPRGTREKARGNGAAAAKGGEKLGTYNPERYMQGLRELKSAAMSPFKCSSDEDVELDASESRQDEFGVPIKSNKSTLMNAFLCGADEPPEAA